MLSSLPGAPSTLTTEKDDWTVGSALSLLLVPSQVRVVNEELYRKTLEEIVRSLDKMENANIPSVTLSKREVGKTQIR